MKRNEFMFFSSQRVRQLVRARRADGHVRVAAERALLHPRVRDPELDDRLAQELQEALAPARPSGCPAA